MELAEVAFFTDNVEALTAFYKSLLGFDPVQASDGMAVFLAGKTKVLIHRNYVPGEGDLPPENHLAFEVQDLDATCAGLRARGLVFEAGPRTYYWGRSAYLRAPGGQLIELMEQE